MTESPSSRVRLRNRPAGIIGFVVDDDVKADRYITKLLKASSQVRIIDRGPGPVKGTVLIRVGPKGH